VYRVISSAFHRRRIERFAALIDETGDVPRRHARSATDDDVAGLARVSQRLSDLPLDVQAHPEFRDGLRAMLMATIERDGIGATAVAPESEHPRRLRGLAPRRPVDGRPVVRRTRARGAIVVGLAAGTLALSGMSAASGDAIPGDALYSVKRSTERAQLALAGSDISRGQLHLEFAKTRLLEAQAVHANLPGLTRILDDMDADTRQGVRLLAQTAADRRDPAALDVIDSFVAAQRTAMDRLTSTVNGDASTRVDVSAGLLEDVRKRSTQLRGVLKCATVAASSDSLGPTPIGQCKVTSQRPNTPGGTKPNTGTNSRPATTPPAGTGPAAPVESTPVETGTPSPSVQPEDKDLLDGVRGILGNLFD
jgi:hypothetical protein